MTNLKLSHLVEKKCTMLGKPSRWIAICEFDEKFDIWFNEDTIAQRFNSYILFHCEFESYALSDISYRTEIELLVFKLCPVLFG